MGRVARLAIIIPLISMAAPAYAALPATDPAIAAANETVRAARKTMMNDPTAALAIGVGLERRAAGVSDGPGRQIMLAKARWIAGEANLRLNKFDEARKLIKSSLALAVASGDPQSQGDAMLSRGSIKASTGDPAGALQDYMTAFQLFQRSLDARSQSITLQYIASLYSSAQDSTRAASYLRLAAEVYHGEPLTELARYNNFANVLSDLGRYSEAQKEFRQGLAIARRLGLAAVEITMLSNLAASQIKHGKLADASQTVDEMISLSRRTGTPLRNGRVTISRLALAQGDVERARRILVEVFSPAGSRSKLSEYDEYHAYQVFNAAGDTRLALRHLEVAMRLRNDAVTLATSNKAALMSARFDFATQNLRIAALNATSLQREMRLQREAAARTRKISIASSLLVLGVVTFLAAWLAGVRRSRNKFQAINAELEQANAALQVASREVSERALAEQRAMELSLQDPLTGLPNRRQLTDDFLAGLERRKKPGQELFVLLLDLDRFKSINDYHGHEVGDRVLVATASRLLSVCERASATAIRLGGDEFVVVMSSTDSDGAQQLANTLICELGLPIDIDERRLAVGVSIGIARSSQAGITIGEMLRAADTAMYEAKRAGRNNVCFFDPAMKARERLRAA